MFLSLNLGESWFDSFEGAHQLISEKFWTGGANDARDAPGGAELICRQQDGRGGTAHLAEDILIFNEL